MFERFSLTQFKALKGAHASVAVHREIPGDRVTPVGAFHALGRRARGGALLESGLTGDLGRYSFLHFTPVGGIRARDGAVTVTEEGRERRVKDDPFTVIRSLMKHSPVKSGHFLSRYTGGLIGFVGYDCIRYFENIPDRHQPSPHLPDLIFRRYRDTIAFDHEQGKVVVSTLVPPGQSASSGFSAAEERIEAMIRKLENAPFGSLSAPKISQISSPSPRTTMVKPRDAAFRKAVLKAKNHISKGEVFQVVLSRTFESKTTAAPFDIYRALRLVNPSPFMFFLDYDDASLLGASPENLVSLENGKLSISPLAGTRPFTKGKAGPETEKDLLSDPKERAEHMMLVDLARNDIGAIAAPGSVKVTELMKVKRFSHVLHISSTVNGILGDGFDAVDALRCAFPAGTLTGAPKIRAMEIIDELETSRRGFYGGAVCAFDTAGGLNSCITIRSALVAGGKTLTRAGAGIVADSDPQREADETCHKAEAVLAAVKLAEKGLT